MTVWLPVPELMMTDDKALGRPWSQFVASFQFVLVPPSQLFADARAEKMEPNTKARVNKTVKKRCGRLTPNRGSFVVR